VGEVRLAEVDRIVDEFLWDRALFTPMSAQELQALMRDDAVTVLDVRPESEFRAGHISGARSIPVAELSARLDEIPIDRPVVAYCRGPYCVFADDAVRLLTERGFAAHRLDEGLPEWRTAGLPVEVGSAIKEEEQS
jgi:rhodanese-related sulfurtransferase